MFKKTKLIEIISVVINVLKHSKTYSENIDNWTEINN